MGWLHQRLAAFEAGKEVFSASFRVRFSAYFQYIGALLHDWSGSASILSSFAASSSPDPLIYSDASGEFGFGALEMTTKSFGCGVWTKVEIADATRAKAVSSTYLEVLAIIRAVKTFARPNTTVEAFSDSAAAIFILQKRYDRKSEVSQALIISLDRYCRDNGIAIFFTHVPREHPTIQLVDSLSKGSMPLGLRSGGWKRVNLKLVSPTFF
jgi:ribonuclease HI